MSADASLDLGASPVRASESTNLMVAEDSRNHVHCPVRVPYAHIANLLRDCLHELGSPTDDPSDMASEVFLVVIAAVLETNKYTAEFPFVAANCVPALRIAAEQHLAALQRHARPAATPGPAPPAAPLAASSNPLADHWKYDGSRPRRWRGRRAGARGGAAAQGQDVLRPAPCGPAAKRRATRGSRWRT
jgi:hypothetical protein